MNTIGLECLECRSLDAIALLRQIASIDVSLINGMLESTRSGANQTDLPPGRARKSSFKPLNIKDYSRRYAAGRTANVIATVLGKSSPRA
jgi:hypothetical protein